MGLVIFLALIVLILIIGLRIFKAFMILVWHPFVLTRRLKNQGISGPNYRIFYGNLSEIKKMKRESHLSILDPSSNDIFPRILPHYQKWMSQYGETFLYWNGTEPRICISDPELAKTMLSNKLGFFVKSKARPEAVKLVGSKGLVFIEGADWVRHRRILNPAFSIDRLKIMTTVMVDCTLKMLEEWRKESTKEETEHPKIKKEMNEEFQRLTADIIATSAFGSSYVEGIEVFRSQMELKRCYTTSLNQVSIPGTQYLPTPSNIRVWKLERKMDNSIKRIISSRLQSKSDYGDDLLGILLKAYNTEGKERKMSIEEIIHECRTFFFGGHETTSNLLAWTTMLLSLHQDWQEKLREEIFKECGKEKTPDSETFSKLKLMNMVIMESLRLYGPVSALAREASVNIKLGDLEIPKGTTVVIPLLKMHSDKTLWGSDADKFNPMRFANGVSRAANHPNALLAFSVGPRACIGQNFVMIEAKTVLTMILQRFRFISLCDEYKHTPVDNVTIQPQYGLPVMLQPLED
ncbi:Cytochrome P450 superfamily [Arabidopsis thaliana x Arabidopsis arenosa]|uniref:Cytochrome P450 709B1 n=6 Tax=Arabidopsis TaxID=3701 RepID=C7091_ARATH|nr:cytochrome P450, family 709, subfamily B, polypeptide 1 [Arabidopsis thaliana]Q9ASR3.1 RecName: Full=Cytochrome P450 709B1 [Arabidopsis thaliana]KAG7639990.1 Cytochrome P450 superfamily [Arabidopsis thaliana x Arabidopsis arenosa]AAC34227.2 putative cytochrome P450 [Arabidopsis thaliana]AAK32916.1 At2g46960/F14M4.21 [Arabidopsis thaliana]AAM10287.1 At2g46960/F14M4.21 [Arabidopsis thaliana]AEC10778.1 cytochrome P450, family 709, subfamily B, polypeptide 1 [Arabidopsis thaliana]|eukprot:NP_566092.1 cytochrome P450, family 709, subfamily B, polypeptide 1 [Arabidopsis thaliana]